MGDAVMAVNHVVERRDFLVKTHACDTHEVAEESKAASLAELSERITVVLSRIMEENIFALQFYSNHVATE